MPSCFLSFFLSLSLLEPCPPPYYSIMLFLKMPVCLCTNLKEVWLFPYGQQLLNKIYVAVVTKAWLGLIFGTNSPRWLLIQSFRTLCWQQLCIFNISFYEILEVTIPVSLNGKGEWGSDLQLDLEWLASPPSTFLLPELSDIPWARERANRFGI